MAKKTEQKSAGRKSSEQKISEQKNAKTGGLEPYSVIKRPLSTEKCMRQVEFENKLVFIVDVRATKQDVKKAVENLFKVKVVHVNIQNSITGDKKAHVKLSPSTLASDLSADLGLI
ncbi:50S ribosomal protein L23 [Candidatus Woesearchaeota archaeon]|nr:50S ribosomal protein L23 [Candidatus Woesearchaeota archaeon]